MKRGGLGVDVGEASADVHQAKRFAWRACTARRMFSSHREPAEQIGDLERAADAGARDVLGLEARRSSWPGDA